MKEVLSRMKEWSSWEEKTKKLAQKVEELEGKNKSEEHVFTFKDSHRLSWTAFYVAAAVVVTFKVTLKQ